jgi:hypothetical protein
MKILLIGAAVAALASPAIAQTTMDPAQSTTTGTAQSPTTSQPSADAETAIPAAPTDARTIIASEFPSYDKDSNGALSKAEFDGWMTAMRDRAGEKPLAAKEQTTWLKGAFATADADKSKTVSQDELTTFLTAKG